MRALILFLVASILPLVAVAASKPDAMRDVFVYGTDAKCVAVNSAISKKCDGGSFKNRL
jgi:hypothetical protein